jgi:hypothetical protein
VRAADGATVRYRVRLLVPGGTVHVETVEVRAELTGERLVAALSAVARTQAARNTETALHLITTDTRPTSPVWAEKLA